MLLAPKEFVHSQAALADSYTKEQAEQYTRWLATNHYENFHVVSFLLPKRLHQDFYNVYALKHDAIAMTPAQNPVPST